MKNKAGRSVARLRLNHGIFVDAKQVLPAIARRCLQMRTNGLSVMMHRIIFMVQLLIELAVFL
jgi:hypothetical protein